MAGLSSYGRAVLPWQSRPRIGRSKSERELEYANCELARKIEPHGRLLRWWALTGGISAGVTALEIQLPDGQARRLHGDFWPGNVLWQDGRLAAVIDWEDACCGDPLSDLAISSLAGRRGCALPWEN